MVLQSCCRVVAAVVFLLGANWILSEDAPVKGDLWQVTSKMTGAGMPNMPGQVTQVCAEKVWTHLPQGNNQYKCKRANFEMMGDTATWTEHCQSPQMMGKGKITRQGTDAYTGSIKFDSAQGSMTIKFDGQRVGECENPL
jgi:hypothetical protein